MKYVAIIAILVLLAIAGFLFMESWRDALIEAQAQGDLRILAKFHTEFIRDIDGEEGVNTYRKAVHDLVSAHPNQQSLKRFERFLNEQLK